jgi:hypothetical protein
MQGACALAVHALTQQSHTTTVCTKKGYMCEYKIYHTATKRRRCRDRKQISISILKHQDENNRVVRPIGIHGRDLANNRSENLDHRVTHNAFVHLVERTSMEKGLQILLKIK